MEIRFMYADAEEKGKELEKKNEMKELIIKMDKDPRIIKVSRMARKLSIDKLPQFFTILKRGMSLV